MIARWALFLMLGLTLGAFVLSLLTLTSQHQLSQAASFKAAHLDQQMRVIYQTGLTAQIAGLQQALAEQLPTNAKTTLKAAFAKMIEENLPTTLVAPTEAKPQDVERKLLKD